MDLLGAAEPLNQFLCGLHRPTQNVSRTLAELVAFPSEIRSLPDAELLDLSVAAEMTAHDSEMAVVTASGRYSTSARLSQAKLFYEQEFRRAGASLASVNSTRAGTRATITASMRVADVQHRITITIDELHGYRAVKVTAEYQTPEHRQLFDRFAHWHNGQAPVSFLARPTGVEITTFASGRRPSTLALYTTHFACAQTPLAQRRAIVEERMSELGWTYREPRHGILFVTGCEFPAETHVLGDEHSSVVSFVGEFQLR